MMAKQKPGLPSDFTFDMDDDTPARSGDYLDELVAPTPAAVATAPPKKPATANKPPKEKLKAAAADAEQDAETPTTEAAETTTVTVTKRARLNVSMEGRKRLEKIVRHMRDFGPEPDVRASEVLEALVLALHEHREHLDLGNVRRRGRYGSTSHKNFPTALAESIAAAIATGQETKLL